MNRTTAHALLAGFAALLVLVATALLVRTGAGGTALGSDAPGNGEEAAPASSGNWVGTWAAPPAAAEPNTRRGHTQTSLRNVVHTSVGGTRARIHLSNLFGEQPLTISRSTIALAVSPSNPTAVAGSMRTLTYGGSPAVTIAPGRQAVSDPVRLNVPAAADLLVSTFTSTPSGPVTYHPFARQTNYVAEGDRTSDVSGAAYDRQTPFWRYLTGVDVHTTEANGSVAVLGDSLTDGITSSVGANRRWTDFLSERLRTEAGAPRYGVLNAGISGNRVLVDGAKYSPNNGPSALNRIRRDALDRTGVKVLVVELGLNDIFKYPRQRDPRAIVEGLRELVRTAHGRGVQVVGGTLTPFGGRRGAAEQPQLDAVRQQVNDAIRSGTVFDEVVDFDEALRDPARPDRLLPAYDSGDGLHPNDNGYRAMAEALDLALLKGSVAAQL